MNRFEQFWQDLRKHPKLVLLIFAPTVVMAQAVDEAEIACNLAQAQATVVASELKAPSAYVSASNQISQKYVAFGISQSMSGFIRAGKMYSAADAQCAALQASVKLEQYSTWSTVDIQKKGAIASLRVINDAIDLAEANLKTLAKQLDSSVVTVTDISVAEDMVGQLYQRKAFLMTTIATEIPPIEFTDISGLVGEFQSNQAKAARLNAKAQAHSGWDITLEAGESKPIGSGQVTETRSGFSPFVTATLKYSFGTHASMKAAEEVGKNTLLLAQNQQLGYGQMLDRHRKEIQTLMDSEVSNLVNFNRELATLSAVHKPLVGINSLLAVNARKALEVRIKTLEAELAGSTVRLDELKVLFAKMQ